jgi:hypothetical protein
VDGDGGFQLNIQDLETVARLSLPQSMLFFTHRKRAISYYSVVHPANPVAACGKFGQNFTFGVCAFASPIPIPRLLENSAISGTADETDVEFPKWR